jgi:hypothetical protein
MESGGVRGSQGESGGVRGSQGESGAIFATYQIEPELVNGKMEFFHNYAAYGGLLDNVRCDQRMAGSKRGI